VERGLPKSRGAESSRRQRREQTLRRARCQLAYPTTLVGAHSILSVAPHFEGVDEIEAAVLEVAHVSRGDRQVIRSRDRGDLAVQCSQRPTQRPAPVHHLPVEERCSAVEIEHALLFSAASSWEIALKYAQGKLALPDPPSRDVPSRLQGSGVTPIPVQHAHALRVAELPLHHRDPFDRLLVAQSQLERAPLLTVDEKLRAYDVELVWAN